MIARENKTKVVEVALEPFLEKIEVAQLLRRTVRSVDLMVSRGLIPHYKFDSRMSFRWSEIQAAFAKSCRVPATCDLTASQEPIANSRGQESEVGS